MKNLTEYFNELTESVDLNGTTLKIGDWVLDLSIKHVANVKAPGTNNWVRVLYSTPKDVKDKQLRNVETDKSVPDLIKWAIKAHIEEKPIHEILKIVNRLYKEGNRDPKLFAVNEVDAMKKMKITTEVDLEETEGLYNTTDDRWSRRAKHQLSKNELQGAVDQSEFSKGEIAVYEGQEVEVRIPVGPNGTTGIMLEGHLKMVKRSDLSELAEGMGVMGAMKPLGPINRIMQLAGLEHSAVVTETDTEEVIEEEVIEEANVSSMFNNIYNANLNNPSYKNNPEAARVATVGQILAGLQSIIGDLPQQLPPDIERQLEMVPGIGASLLQAATGMTKPTSMQGAAE